MANYPQLDDCSGVWTLKEVNDAVMGGYWRNVGLKGIVAGGTTDNNTPINTIQQISMGSTGDASDFGDSSVPIQESSGASSPIRGIFVTGSPNSHDHLEALEFATLGNERRFGDLTQARNHNCSASNCHGGLG